MLAIILVCYVVLTQLAKPGSTAGLANDGDGDEKAFIEQEIAAGLFHCRNISLLSWSHADCEYLMGAGLGAVREVGMAPSLS